MFLWHVSLGAGGIPIGTGRSSVGTYYIANIILLSKEKVNRHKKGPEGPFK